MNALENRFVVGVTIVVVLWGELLLMQQKFLSGVLLYSVMLLSLLLYGAFRWKLPQHQLMVLAIPAVARLLNFSLPLGELSPMFAQMIVGVPMAFMAMVFVWLMKQGQFSFRVEWRRVPLYLLLIVVGIGAGFLLFQLNTPVLLVWDTLPFLFYYIFVLVAGMAFLEEWLFRGIMQTALTSLFSDGFAILAVATIYTILHIGQGSLHFIGTIFLFSLGLGWLRHTSDDLLGVCLVHGTANLVFFLVLPMM
jgi:uncharacterized protein